MSDPKDLTDLAAALAGMPEGEREEVLTVYASREMCDAVERAENQASALVRVATEKVNEATARAEAAERERDRMAREFGTCPGELPDDGEIARVVRERAEFRARAEAAERECARLRLDAAQRDRDWTVIRTLTDAAYGPATTVEAVRRVVSERDSLRESVAAREKERDEARLDLDRAQAALAVVRHDLEGTRRDLGELRTRAIAAETAAAQREPREYPLAEGSKWIDNVIRDADGSQSWVAGGQVVTDGPLTSGLRYTYRQSARNLAALLDHAGLL